MAARPVTGPEKLRQQAQLAAASGDLKAARAILEQACTQFPDSAPLANTAGHLAMRADMAAQAEGHFARALALEPDNLEFALNHAIALARLGRDREALAVLQGHEAEGATNRRYCSARAAAHRTSGELSEAARWYDRCLALGPDYAKALNGRARVALERGEPDALQRFERGLAANPKEPDLWLGMAQALDAAGEPRRALQIAEQLVRQAPGWLDALRLLAQLRLTQGDRDFAGHYAEAAGRAPADPAIPLAHIEVLGGLDMAAQAADIAAEADKLFADEPRFALLQAVHAGVAGDNDRAEAIFASLGTMSLERLVQEARHRIRVGEAERAEALLDRAAEVDPWSIAVWALRGIVWRLTGDGRADWLHGQPGLMRKIALPDGERVLTDAVPLLNRLHDISPMPLGQSLRGGTQTRGNLFDRTEPELAALHEALLNAIEEYRAGLPPSDAAHPLLRNRDTGWKIAGSWSVRLQGGGDYHTAHIHPQGIVSSALYCIVAEGAEQAREQQAGWLELGRPAPDLRLDLPPLAGFEPVPGHLALFPSTLYHGTRPFSRGRRMSVAFDVARAGDEKP